MELIDRISQIIREDSATNGPEVIAGHVLKELNAWFFSDGGLTASDAKTLAEKIPQKHPNA